MSIRLRIVTVTTGLVLAGTLSGAVSGIAAIEVAVLTVMQALAPLKLAWLSSAMGAAFGAIVAPTLAWAALRQVPIGRAIIAIAVGAGSGGAIGILVGASMFNPYYLLVFIPAPAPQGLIGALVGATVATVYSRIRAAQTSSGRRAR